MGEKCGGYHIFKPHYGTFKKLLKKKIRESQVSVIFIFIFYTFNLMKK